MREDVKQKHFCTPLRGTSTDQQDYFVHHTAIVMDRYRQLFDGQGVSFNVVEGRSGKTQAANVTMIQKSSVVMLVNSSLEDGGTIEGGGQGVQVFAHSQSGCLGPALPSTCFGALLVQTHLALCSEEVRLPGSH